MKKYYTYIATNYANTTLYIGVTNNQYLRADQHKYKHNPDSFSARYKMYKILWLQEFDNPRDAIAAEKKIKGWTREKKLTLIRKDNPELRDLARADAVRQIGPRSFTSFRMTGENAQDDKE